jgi:hypothetical protein
MTTRVDRLKAYRAAAMETVPVIGVDDCAPWVAKWIEQETGVRVGFFYSDRQAGIAAVEQAGGLVALLDPLMKQFEETLEPKPGDVGVVNTGTKEMAAIFCGHDHVLIRGEPKGVYHIRARGFLKAWALP